MFLRPSTGSPLRAIPLLRPAALVLGYTPAARLTWEIARLRGSLPTLEGRLASACRALGDANRMKGKKALMRRFWQAKAFRSINAARAHLRAERKRLAAAEVELAALATQAA